jgi:hypothetical protein
MRQWKWAGMMIMGLGLAMPAWGQQSSTFGGVNPTQIVNQPIDTSQSVVPIARPQRLANAGFSLRNILPRVGLPGAKPIIGQSQFPTPQGMPGANYLRAFGFQRPVPIQP